MQRGHHSKQGNMAAVGEAAAFYLERSHLIIGEALGDLNHSFRDSDSIDSGDGVFTGDDL